MVIRNDKNVQREIKSYQGLILEVHLQNLVILPLLSPTLEGIIQVQKPFHDDPTFKSQIMNILLTNCAGFAAEETLQQNKNQRLQAKSAEKRMWELWEL
jgi:hypothetical protein